MAKSHDVVFKWNEIWMQLPRHLALQAAPIVKAGAERSRDRVRAAYPRKTGRLQDGVKLVVTPTADPAICAYRVKSTAPHARIYEFGSHRQRARPTFLPITRQEQRQTTEAVIAMLEAAGFGVSGGQK